jgi:hypothetical protein
MRGRFPRFPAGRRKARTGVMVFTERLTDVALYFAVFEWMRINFVQ